MSSDQLIQQANHIKSNNEIKARKTDVEVMEKQLKKETQNKKNLEALEEETCLNIITRDATIYYNSAKKLGFDAVQMLKEVMKRGADETVSNQNNGEASVSGVGAVYGEASNFHEVNKASLKKLLAPDGWLDDIVINETINGLVSGSKMTPISSHSYPPTMNTVDGEILKDGITNIANASLR